MLIWVIDNAASQSLSPSHTYRLVAELEHFAAQIGRLAELDAHVAHYVRPKVGPLLRPVHLGPRRGLALASADGPERFHEARRHQLATRRRCRRRVGAARESGEPAGALELFVILDGFSAGAASNLSAASRRSGRFQIVRRESCESRARQVKQVRLVVALFS